MADAASSGLNPLWLTCTAGAPQKVSGAEYKMFGSAQFKQLFKTENTGELSINVKVDFTDNSVSGELQQKNRDINYNIDKVDTQCKFKTPPSSTGAQSALPVKVEDSKIFEQSNPPFTSCAAKDDKVSYTINTKYDQGTINNIISDLDNRQDVDITISQDFVDGHYDGKISLDDGSSNEKQIDLSLTGADIKTECSHKIKIS